MRIENHPILTFTRGKKISFFYDGQEMEGFEGDTIAGALHALGVKVFGHSHRRHRPRGFYCGIGNCSSCLMTVDGVPNVRICITELSQGMEVRTQKGRGELIAQD